MNHPFRLNAVASLFAASLSPFAIAADAPPPLVDVVVVSGSRVEHASFDLPAAIDVVDASRMRDNQMRVNASEALAAVPGLVAQNRQNYAQDLQISSRGFGARSAFGVRGVRLIADGIPATMPDGQGQAATFNLDVAERMEVLRGPFRPSTAITRAARSRCSRAKARESRCSRPASWRQQLRRAQGGPECRGRSRRHRLPDRRLAFRDRRLPQPQRRHPRPGLRQAHHRAFRDQPPDRHRQRAAPERHPGPAGRNLGHLSARSARRMRPTLPIRSRPSAPSPSVTTRARASTTSKAT
ncbi:Plug domain-containing protein [Massilia sp. H-1]|nr:Plug domain-containing protein [Massilia sp. H-1]